MSFFVGIVLGYLLLLLLLLLNKIHDVPRLLSISRIQPKIEYLASLLARVVFLVLVSSCRRRTHTPLYFSKSCPKLIFSFSEE